MNPEQEKTCHRIQEYLPSLLSENQMKLRMDASCSFLESQRLFHGRGGCYPGLEFLSIDWYAPVILITWYKGSAYQDLFQHESGSENESGSGLNQSEQQLATLFESILVNFFEIHYPDQKISAIVLQSRINKLPISKVIYGALPEWCFAREANLDFYLDIFEKQNIGFFLDMRNARQWLASQCAGKKVLNLFSFTCAFSVVALAGGAKSVVNVDMVQGVLKRGEQNHQLNKLDTRSAQFIKADIFKVWKKLKKYGPYDIIVIDPPSFQPGSFQVEKDYSRVVKNLTGLLAPKAQILACLNSPFLGEAFLDQIFLEEVLNQHGHSIQKQMRLDNPASFCDQNPDSGLKVVVYHYQRIEAEIHTNAF